MPVILVKDPHQLFLEVKDYLPTARKGKKGMEQQPWFTEFREGYIPIQDGWWCAQGLA